MRLRRTLCAWLVGGVLLLALTACGVDPDSVPTFTPDPNLAATAVALFPAPLPTVTLTPTPVVRGDAGEEIARLLNAMQAAVITGDANGYLALVDLSDPVFALEHTRWVEDWQSPRVTVMRFELSVRNLVVSGDEATGDLNMLWTVLSGIEITHGADFAARFTYSPEVGWRYAGEQWQTIESAHFRVRAAPGLESIAQAVADMMPGIYDHVTASLDFVPEEIGEIKLYDNAWAMLATVRLSILDPIAGWNEPGEALKLVADDIPAESTLAHEFTHYVMFEVAGRSRGLMPWWTAEGIAMYVASRYWTFTDRSRYIALVQEWQRTNELAAWDEISDFEATPESLWSYAYGQGYAFIRYVTEAYGQAQRNAWLRTMSDQPIGEATQTVFGMTFENLSAAFLDWLAGQG